MTILVVAEMKNGTPTSLTREILGLARMLDADINHPHPSPPADGKGTHSVPLRGKAGMGVVAVAFAPNAEALADLAIHGADRVYWCEQPEEYDGESWLAAVEQLARESQPVAILASHTTSGADLTPRLAFRLETGVATGCTAVQAHDGKLLLTRPCYGGNVRETLSFGVAPAVATVKPGAGVVTTHTHGADVVRVSVPAFNRRTRIVARQQETPDTRALEDAKIIVAGGRGLEGPEGFRVLENLAEVLGAAVGSSRVPCDLGWCPHSWQIGLTGKTVTPDLYFAIGISGAGHHMAGCGNAKTIVAINTDPDAAIFRDARYGIVGDYRKVVPALVDALRTLDRT
jgi:electron transfer flavoprotein alpha subunit